MGHASQQKKAPARVPFFVAGCGVEVAGCGVQGAGCRLQVKTGCKFQVTVLSPCPFLIPYSSFLIDYS